METLYTHVGGIDVHKKQVTVTARTPDPKRAGRRETTRTFRTFYGDLLAMVAWLVGERGVRHVAMESTGAYWWPVYAALREVGGADLAIEVVNAAHVKAVPGRKTDLLTELTDCCFGCCVPGGSVAARLAARDQRRGRPAGLAWAGGAADRVA